MKYLSRRARNILRQTYKITTDGYLTEIQVAEFDEQGNCTEELPEDIITVDPPDGLYRTKWTGTEWIEDMTQEEIDEMYNKHIELTESDLILLAIAELDVQRESDKAETQLAIAELAETLLGGI